MTYEPQGRRHPADADTERSAAMSLHDALSHVESAIDDLDAADIPRSLRLQLTSQLRAVAEEVEAAIDLPNDETPPENA